MAPETSVGADDSFIAHWGMVFTYTSQQVETALKPGTDALTDIFDCNGK
jgi:hypothetical protein